MNRFEDFVTLTILTLCAILLAMMVGVVAYAVWLTLL